MGTGRVGRRYLQALQGAAHPIENKARGYDVAAEIYTQYARENWNVELVEPVGDKVARGHSVVPIFTNGGVWAPDTAWANNIIKQCGLVPKSAHDDLYDTVTQFLKWARERGIIVMTEEVDAAIRDRLTYKPQERTTIAQQYGV
jgi:predicted phage terminase large subunit-like protein